MRKFDIGGNLAWTIVIVTVLIILYLTGFFN